MDTFLTFSTLALASPLIWVLCLLCGIGFLGYHLSYHEREQSFNGWTISITLMLLYVFWPVVWQFFTGLTIVQGLLYTGGYFVLGAVWSVYKWQKYLRVLCNSLKDYLETDASELTRAEAVNPDGSINMSKLATWKQAEFLPTTHTSLLIHWITYWPISLLWDGLHLILCDVANWIFTRILGVYKYIAKRTVSQIKIDIKK